MQRAIDDAFVTGFREVIGMATGLAVFSAIVAATAIAPRENETSG